MIDLDDETFARLLERERPAVLQRIHSRLGRRLARVEDPEDILQETWMVALRSRASLRARDRAGLRAWLMRIAENRILTLSRKSSVRVRPRKRTALPAALVELHEPTAPALTSRAAPGPTDELLEREHVYEILGRLSRLPRTERLAVVLRDFARLSWSATALLVGRDEPATRRLHRRALRRLGPEGAAR